MPPGSSVAARLPPLTEFHSMSSEEESNRRPAARLLRMECARRRPKTVWIAPLILARPPTIFLADGGALTMEGRFILRTRRIILPLPAFAHSIVPMMPDGVDSVRLVFNPREKLPLAVKGVDAQPNLGSPHPILPGLTVQPSDPPAASEVGDGSVKAPCRRRISPMSGRSIVLWIAEVTGPPNAVATAAPIGAASNGKRNHIRHRLQCPAAAAQIGQQSEIPMEVGASDGPIARAAARTVRTAHEWIGEVVRSVEILSGSARQSSANAAPTALPLAAALEADVRHHRR